MSVAVDNTAVRRMRGDYAIPTLFSGSGSILLPNQKEPKQINNWDDWREWRVSVNYLEEIIGYNFLSNLSDDIEEVIEDDESSNLILSRPSASLLVVPETTFSFGNSTVSAEIATSNDLSIGHDSTISIPTEGTTIVNGSFKVSANHFSINNVAVSKIGSSEITVIEGSKHEVSLLQISVSENSSVQERTEKFSSSQSSSFQVDPFKVNLHQISSTQINTCEISFSGSVSLQQLLRSYLHL